MALVWRKIEFPVPEMGESKGRSGLGRNIRSLVRGILSIRSLGDVQVVPWIFRVEFKRGQAQSINFAVFGRMRIVKGCRVDEITWGMSLDERREFKNWAWS